VIARLVAVKPHAIDEIVSKQQVRLLLLLVLLLLVLLVLLLLLLMVVLVLLLLQQQQLLPLLMMLLLVALSSWVRIPRRAAVRENVALQVALVRKVLVAPRTLERLVARVRSLVHREMMLLGEAPPAMALEGLLTRVRPHVSQQVAARRELLAADLAVVALAVAHELALEAVRAAVLREVVLAREALPTHGAAERPHLLEGGVRDA
jgi:hypothetical protein